MKRFNWDRTPDLFRKRPPQWSVDLATAGKVIYHRYYLEIEELKKLRKNGKSVYHSGVPFPHNKIVKRLIDEYEGAGDKDRIRKLILCRSGGVCAMWMDRVVSGKSFLSA